MTVNKEHQRRFQPIIMDPTVPRGTYFTKCEYTKRFHRIYANAAQASFTASDNGITGRCLVTISPTNIGKKATTNRKVFSSKSGGIS